MADGMMAVKVNLKKFEVHLVIVKREQNNKLLFFIALKQVIIICNIIDLKPQ